MTNAIQLFNYGEHPVRTVVQNGQIWWVAKDVCNVLGYTNARDAISKHLDDDERMVSRIATPSNGGYSDVNIINQSGLFCLILRSNMPKAKEFRRWVTETVLPQVMKYGLPEQTGEKLTNEVMYATRMILEAAGIKDNQLALALDKVAEHYTGHSLLALSGTILLAPNKCQILTPTEIGKHFGVSARKVNELLCREGYQKLEGKNYEPLEAGMPYAVMLDTNKRHSDGTPIRQLKWESSFINEIEELFPEQYK